MSSPKPPKGRPVSRTQAARAGGSSSVPLFAIGVGLLVVVAIVAVLVIALTGDDDGGGEAVEADGRPAPVLTGTTADGEPITIDPADDGPMLIAFVAHWCPHCQAEVPRIVDLYGDSAELDGVELVAVSTGANPAAENYPPEEWLEREEWPGQVVMDDEQQSLFVAYEGESYPYLVAVDEDGRIVARASGEQGEDGLQALVDAAAGTDG